MKKIINKNKLLIIGIIIGILFSSAGVYAANVYNANQITYKDTTVEAAINDLYNKRKCVNGTYQHNANTQLKIDIGFVPKSFNFSLELIDKKYRYFDYNANINRNVFILVYNNGSLYAEDHTSEFSIDTTISSNFPTSYLVYTDEFVLYYTACK